MERPNVHTKSKQRLEMDEKGKRTLRQFIETVITAAITAIAAVLGLGQF